MTSKPISDREMLIRNCASSRIIQWNMHRSNLEYMYMAHFNWAAKELIFCLAYVFPFHSAANR